MVLKLSNEPLNIDEENHSTDTAVLANLSTKEKEWQGKLLYSLQRLEALGFDEKKYMKQVENAKDKKELQILEDKFKEAGFKFYKQGVQRSGAFTPILPAEATFMDWKFGGILLNVETASFDEIIDSIEEMNSLIKKESAFRNRLKGQSLAIQELYCERVAPNKHGEALLKQIITENEIILKKPLSIQKEFLKDKFKDEDTLKKTEEAFAKLHKPYLKEIQENMHYFGGNKISTPYGKMPAAAWEFLAWFQGRPDFKSLELALKALPKEIAKRRELFEEANSLIKHLPKNEIGSIQDRIAAMRRHELEEFLTELEDMAKNKSAYVLECHKNLRAKHRGFPLFQSAEIRQKLSAMQKRKPEDQATILKYQKLEIEDARESVNTFLQSPPLIQKKYAEEFRTSNEAGRLAILARIDKEIKAKNSLEALVGTDEIEEAKKRSITPTEDLEAIKKALLNEKMIKQQFEKMKEENAFQRLKTQESAKEILEKNIGTTEVQNLEYGQDIQTEAYIKAYKKWMKIRPGLNKEEDALDDRERAQIKKINRIRDGYTQGKLVDSHITRERKDITLGALEDGHESIQQEIDTTKYKTDIRIQSRNLDGDARKDLNKIQEAELKELAHTLLHRLIENQGAHLSINTKENLEKSDSLVKSITEYINGNI